MSSETDHPRQRTVAELLAEHGDGAATGRRRRRRAADGPAEEDSPAAPVAYAPPEPDRSVLREPVSNEQDLFQQAPYEQAPYDQAPYDQAPHDQAPYDPAPYERPAYEPDSRATSLWDAAPQARDRARGGPVYEAPARDEPVYEEPVHQEPVYQEPVYQERGYTDRRYGGRAHEEPEYDQRAYDQPAYDQPAYDRRTYDERRYEPAPPAGPPARDPRVAGFGAGPGVSEPTTDELPVVQPVPAGYQDPRRNGVDARARPPFPTEFDDDGNLFDDGSAVDADADEVDGVDDPGGDDEAPARDSIWRRARGALTRKRPPPDGGPPTEAAAPLDLDDLDDLDELDRSDRFGLPEPGRPDPGRPDDARPEQPGGAGRRGQPGRTDERGRPDRPGPFDDPDDPDDRRMRPAGLVGLDDLQELEDFDTEDAEPRRRFGLGALGPGQAWAVVLGQWIGGALGGAVVWVGFRFLWRSLPVVALAAAVLITVGLVVVVRALLRNDDLRTTVFAVLVGLLLTVSPAILVLLDR